MTLASNSEKETDQRVGKHIDRLLNQLASIIIVIVLLAVAVVAGSFYFLQARPLAESNIRDHEHEASEDVVIKVESALSIVERILHTARDWSADGVMSIDDARAFRNLMIPATHHREMIGAVRLADESGREIALLKTPNGWLTRIVDPKKNAQRQHWMAWRDANTPVDEYWTSETYDARIRPWYVHAQAVPEDQISWTQPYILQLNKEPGLSATMRFTDKKTGKKMVVAINVLLVDISRFTTKIKYAKSGQVSLLTSDGKVIGLPRHHNFTTEESMKQSMLKTPEEINLPLLAEALRQAKAFDANETEKQRQMMTMSSTHSKDGQAWLVGIRTFKIRNQNFKIATLAPRSDFTVISRELIATLSGVMVGIVLLAALTAKLAISSFRRPLQEMYTKIEDDRKRVEVQMARRGTVAHVARRLQEAGDAAALGKVLLSELAGRLQLGRAFFYGWNDAAQTLEVIASYGGVDASNVIIPLESGNLVAQCAISKRPIVIEHPKEEFFRIRSGLGSALPKVILLQPIRYGEHLIAVLELASMRALTDEDQTLLNDIESFIAMSLDLRMRADTTARSLAVTTNTKEQFRQILGMVGDGILEVDRQGVATFINKSALNLLGYTEDEILGKALHDGIYTGQGDGGMAAFDENPVYQTMRDGYPRSVGGVRFRHKDGRDLMVDLYVSAIRSESEIAGAIMIFHESAVCANIGVFQHSCEDHLWQIVQASPTPMIVEAEDGKIEVFNQHFADLFKLTSASAPLLHFKDLWAEHEAWEKYADLLNTQEYVDDFAARMKTVDGALLPVILSTKLTPLLNKKFFITWMQHANLVCEYREPEAAPSRQTDFLKLNEVVGRLASALTGNDAMAVAIWDENAKLLKQYLGENAEKIEHAIRRYDYDAAEKSLTSAAQKTGLAIRL